MKNKQIYINAKIAFLWEHWSPTSWKDAAHKKRIIKYEFILYTNFYPFIFYHYVQPLKTTLTSRGWGFLNEILVSATWEEKLSAYYEDI